jgi:FKBP-type peptidyl-prolyl cis-trans isomerase (trigger factor)
MTKLNYKAKIETLDNSRARVTVTVASKDFETLFESAKTKVLSEAKLNGFRDGKVPYEAYVKSYGEFPIRQEMGYNAVDNTYIQVIIKEKLEAIGKPEIAITKVTPGEDFEYQITTDILPKVELGDYKKYSKEFPLEEVKGATEEEINDALEELRRMRITKNDKGEEVLPELDEAFLKSAVAQMGVSFEDYLKHMKKTLAEWKETEKGTAEKQVILQLALHAISKKEDIKVSEETVNNEVAHLMAHYKDLDPERAKAYTEEKMTNSLVAEYLVTGKVPDEKELFGSHEGHNH